jgi:hypothetical protein
MDIYLCPNGKQITAVSESIRKSVSGFESIVTHYRCESSSGCTLQEKCFKSKYPDKSREFEVTKAFFASSSTPLSRSHHGKALC